MGIVWWTIDGDSALMPSQLGRLYIRLLPLPPPENTSNIVGMASIRNAHVPAFLLVLNGTTETPWDVLSERVGFHAHRHPSFGTDTPQAGQFEL